jgi:putative membrane protein
MMLVETTTRALLQAQTAPVLQRSDLLSVLVTTVIFTVFGLVVFGLAYMIIVKLSPFSIRKEIEDDQNTALAIIIGSVIIGVALIIAAAVHG